MIDDWNVYLALYNVQVQRVDEPCGTGPSCVNFEIADLGSECGRTSFDYGAQPFHAGNLKIKIDQSHSNWTSDAMKRTLAHELQHLFGLQDYEDYCPNQADALMNPNFDCNATSHPATAVTKNDHIPVLNSVYGGKSAKTCGF